MVLLKNSIGIHGGFALSCAFGHAFCLENGLDFIVLAPKSDLRLFLFLSFSSCTYNHCRVYDENYEITTSQGIQS